MEKTELTRKRTAIKVAAAAVVGLLALAGCGSSSSDSGKSSDKGKGGTTVVKVAHVTSALFTPLYVAQAKGYFKDAGLDVQLEAIKSGQDSVPLLASGKLDVMVAGFSAGMFNALNSGLKFKVVGSMGISTGDKAKSPTALEVSKSLVDSGKVTKLADLKGKKIAVAGGPGATGGYLLAAILKTADLTLKDVEPVNLGSPDMEAALKSGGVDAALPSAPFSTNMELNGVATALAVPAKGTTGTGVMFGADFAKSATAQKFFSALVKGAKDSQGDLSKNQDVLKIVADATGQKIDVLAKTPFYSWHPDLAPQPDQLDAMQKTWMDAGLLNYDKTIKASTYVEDKFAKAAK
ncbi:ABC transporter substrate-binding protein [Antricoccus suffuscus]|nr:ABC transporter substrate-binding protein [Antricoccus suffuscus]